MRIEREYQCDEIAANAHGGAGQYATALLALEQFRSNMGPKLVSAADGNDPGSLVKRVQRLTQQDSSRSSSLGWAVLALTLVACLAVSVVLAGVSGFSPGDDEDWSKLGTTSYQNGDTEILVLHTPDKIHSVVITAMSPDRSSASSSSGVRRIGFQQSLSGMG